MEARGVVLMDRPSGLGQENSSKGSLLLSEAKRGGPFRARPACHSLSTSYQVTTPQSEHSRAHMPLPLGCAVA